MSHASSIQLVIFVGSRRAGRLWHLERLIRSAPDRFAPLLTVTTRTEAKPGDDVWYKQMSPNVVATYTIDEMLTFFQEGETHYYILKKHVDQVRSRRLTPVVGMSPDGLDRLRTRHGANADFRFAAIILQLKDPERFRSHLMADEGLDPVVADEETARAVRLSTLPPARSMRRSSIIPVPIEGTQDDEVVIDAALKTALTP